MSSSVWVTDVVEAVLEASGLGKKYAKELRASLRYGVRDVIGEITGSRANGNLRSGEFWALKDVSFSLRRGECLAVLGGNGAGKSTLLKMVSGILAPDAGTLAVRGHVEKMIELASGMSPTLTGRQNVLLRCRMMGLSRQDTVRRIDEVVEFAEIDDFIDSPVMYYSSGMRARLGFATTVVMRPEILVIDEVLAVGDLAFRMKCYERVDQMRKGSAVLLVTHGMNHVARMATSSLVLHKGRVAHSGSVQGGISKYQELMGGKPTGADPSFRAELVDVELYADGERVANGGSISYGSRLSMKLRHRVSEPLALSVVLHEGSGPTVADWHSARSEFRAGPDSTTAVDLGKAELCPGGYHFVVVGLSEHGEQRFLSKPVGFKVTGLHLGTTRLQPLGHWRIAAPSSGDGGSHPPDEKARAPHRE